VSEDGRDLDVTFLPSWLHGVTSKPVDKSWNGLFVDVSLSGTLPAGRYLTWKEGKKSERRGSWG